MHIPVLLAGFLVGARCGVIVGALAPGLSYLMTGMPPTYAVPLMSLELPAYGLVAGLTYRTFRLNVFASLLAAVVVGRLFFALGLVLLGILVNLPYSAAAYLSAGGALWMGLPGVAIQFVLVPALVKSIEPRQTASRNEP
jgi:niacin transporter